MSARVGMDLQRSSPLPRAIHFSRIADPIGNRLDRFTTSVIEEAARRDGDHHHVRLVLMNWAAAPGAFAEQGG